MTCEFLLSDSTDVTLACEDASLPGHTAGLLLGCGGFVIRAELAALQGRDVRLKGLNEACGKSDVFPAPFTWTNSSFLADDGGTGAPCEIKAFFNSSLVMEAIVICAPPF